MNILRLNAYFSPEITASNHLVDDLFSEFSKNNINCICHTPQPTRGVSREEHIYYKKYEELYDGYVKVIRFPMFRENKNPLLRAFRYLLCAVIQYYKGINTKNIDIVFSSSTPPIQGMISAMVAKKLSKKYKKKIPFVYNLQDIFPDSLINSKIIKKRGIIWKIGRKIEDYTYLNADKIIVISNTMKNNILKKGVEKEKIVVISNWIDIDNVYPIPKENNFLYKKLNLNDDDFHIVYAGNFGAAQGAEIILKVAEKLEKIEKIKFLIFGGGPYFEKVKFEAKKLKNVIVNDLLPKKYVSNVYSLGNVALITCKPGTGNAGLPSKTWSIMACNIPIIASFDINSELDDIIKISGAGKCVSAGNIDALNMAIKEFYYCWKNNTLKTINTREYVKKNVSKPICVKKYIDIFLQYTNKLY